MSNIEAISKKSIRPISALSPRLKSSTYLSTRVEDPVNRRGGLILGLALISTENPNFEMASSVIGGLKNYGTGFIRRAPDPVEILSILFYDNRISAAFIGCLSDKRLVLYRNFIHLDNGQQLILIVFENFRT
jgi:hypothetical protein